MVRCRRAVVLVALSSVAAACTGAGPASAAASGRLTLAAADVPGLDRVAGGARVARGALPARLPRGLRRARVRGAAFAAGGRRLDVGVFVLASPPRARRALRAASKGLKRAPGLGDGAFRRVRGRAERRRGRASATNAAIVFRVGRAAAAVRYSGRRGFTRAGALMAARAYALALEARLRRVLARTAWQRALEAIGDDGSISPRAALRAFAIAYGSVPGARRPAGRLGTPPSATLAMQLAARVWHKLTPAQRRAVERAVGAPHDPSSPAIAQAAEQTLTPDPALQAIADPFAAFFAQQLGVPAPDIRVFRASEEITTGEGKKVGGDALPVNAKGSWGAGPVAYCRVRVPPGTQKASPQGQSSILAHEVFHCFQFALAPAWTKLAAWIIEGTAAWAEIIAAKTPKLTGMANYYKPYLSNPGVPLPGRAYDAAGFWGRVQEVGGLGSLWANMAAILNGPTTSDAFALAGATSKAFVDTWASATFRFAAAGPAWNQAKPYSVPHTELKPPAAVVSTGTTLGSSPYALRPYVVANDPSAPLVNVTRLSGSLRAGTSQEDYGLVGSDWFCFGECACEAGQAGTVPTHREVFKPLLSLGLTGGAAQGGARVTYHELEEFCSEEPKTGVSVSGATSVTIGGPGYCVRPAPGVFQVQLPLNAGGKKIAQVVLEVTGFTGAGDYPTGPSVATVYDFRPSPAHLWETPVSGSITVQDPGGAAGEGASGTVNSVTSGTSPELGTTKVSVAGRWTCVG